MDNVASTPSDKPELSDRAREAENSLHLIVGRAGPGGGPSVRFEILRAAPAEIIDGETIVVSRQLPLFLILHNFKKEHVPLAHIPATLTIAPDGSRTLTMGTDIDVVSVGLDRRDYRAALDRLRASAHRHDPDMVVDIPDLVEPEDGRGWLRDLLDSHIPSPVQRVLMMHRIRNFGRPIAYAY